MLSFRQRLKIQVDGKPPEKQKCAKICIQSTKPHQTVDTTHNSDGEREADPRMEGSQQSPEISGRTRCGGRGKMATATNIMQYVHRGLTNKKQPMWLTYRAGITPSHGQQRSWQSAQGASSGHAVVWLLWKRRSLSMDHRHIFLPRIKPAFLLLQLFLQLSHPLLHRTTV